MRITIEPTPAKDMKPGDRFRATTERELYDDSTLIDMRDRLSFEPVSLVVADDVDYWEPDRICMKALVWKDA